MRLLLFIALLSTSFQLLSQTDSTNLDEKYLEKVSSIDSVISNLYGVISGEKGAERNWELFHYLFKDGAQMIPSGESKSGEYKLRYSTPADYVKGSGKYLVENGFFEKEIHREVQQFGNIVHVFSSYECFHSKKDKKPFMRGINSIQLIFDNNRWWVVNIYWAQESKLSPIPKEFGG